MGYGDEIMVTGYAKLLKQKYPNVQIVAGNKKKGIVTDSVIFNGNPNIKRFSELKNIQTIWIDSFSGHRPYFTKETEEKYYWNEKHRVIVGDLYMSEEELKFASKTILNAKKWWNEKNNSEYKKIMRQKIEIGELKNGNHLLIRSKMIIFLYSQYLGIVN